MYNICVIDDDQTVFNEIKNHFLTPLRIDYYNDYNENIDLYDIYFIDICLGNRDGVKVAEEIQKNNPDSKIIMISSHNNLVFSALTIRPYFFIRKEFLKEDMMILIGLLENEEDDTIKISSGNHHYYLKVNEIIYYETIGHVLEFHLTHDRIKHIRCSLKSINHKNLIQIHKSYVVNLGYIQSIDGNMCTLMNGTVLSIGRKYKNSLLGKL